MVRRIEPLTLQGQIALIEPMALQHTIKCNAGAQNSQWELSFAPVTPVVDSPVCIADREREAAMLWITRLTLKALIATVMALVGYQLMFKPVNEVFAFDRQSFMFVVPSVLLWSVFAFILRRQTYVTAVGWGVLSPIIGSLLINWAIGPVVAVVMWYVTFPVGVLTGVLVKLCVSFGDTGLP